MVLGQGMLFMVIGDVLMAVTRVLPNYRKSFNWVEAPVVIS